MEEQAKQGYLGIRILQRVLKNKSSVGSFSLFFLDRNSIVQAERMTEKGETSK